VEADERGHRGLGLDHLAQPRLHLRCGGLTDQQRVVLEREEDRDADQDEADEARGRAQALPAGSRPADVNSPTIAAPGPRRAVLE